MTVIFNLVDVCNRCSLVFRIASETSENADFLAYAEETRRMLDRFSYELQTEMRRTDGHIDFGPPRVYREGTRDPAHLLSRCKVLMQDAIDEYQKTLKTPLSAHSRAMLRRQLSGIQNAHEQLSRIRKVA